MEMNDLWETITEKMDSHAYMAGVEREVERVAATGEVFTPTGLVIEMLQSQPMSVYAPGQTVLDPACGDGQFLVAVKWLKMLGHGMSEEAALRDIYGVDIMRDNVDICLRRLGGGTIVMGDVLNPGVRLPKQTRTEHETMIALFGQGT